jgi:fumarate reductase iron-sulfur subunit
MLAELTVSLWRGGKDGRYATYSVPRRESQTVLDVVTFVQRHIDPTLSYRFACRVGVCGSCAMTVNGRPRWTCRTHVAKVAGGGRLEIGPLENLPVIKDLATDMEPFFEKWQKAQGVFAPSKNQDYFGPAALTRAWTLLNDERDAGGTARLQAVAAAGGCHSCHSHQSCQELCPQALNPTAAIAGLKRRTTAAYLKGEIKA